jgi:SAM-dependent methyltransferase
MARVRDSAGVAGYWDANREKSKDPAYWMAHPLCRQAINRRISGNPNEWPLDWFKRVYAPAPYRFGISWGCGLGPFERAAVRIGLAESIEAFDISEKSLEDARREAGREKVSGIDYRLGDFDDPVIVGGRYDVAFFHASLHHVSRLERLFRRLALGLREGGVVYVEEFVGPSRREWRRRMMWEAQEVLDEFPASAKIRSIIDLPIQQDDPSEGVRSGEIRDFLRRYLDVFAWRPYGGQLAGLVFPCLSREWAESPEAAPFIGRLLEREDAQIAENPESSHHLVAAGRFKPLPRLAVPMLLDAVRAIGRARLARPR